MFKLLILSVLKGKIKFNFFVENFLFFRKNQK